MKEGDCPINKINKFSFGSGWQRAIREEILLGNKEYNIAIKKEWERVSRYYYGNKFQNLSKKAE